MNTELSQSRCSIFGPMLVGGFAGTTIMGTAWFFTHMPWLGLEEQLAVPLILVCWFVTLAAFAARVRRDRSITVGLGAGFISGLAGLVFFGSQLGTPATTDGVAPGVVPNAPTLVAGFIGLSLLLGLVAGAVGRVIARENTPDQPAAHWLGRFAIVAALAIAPLIFIGGLVTSTNSGMAVPDWPRTYGANMFLYPLAGHVGTVGGKPYPQVFVEHAHRLFGAFVGLCSFSLLTFTVLVDRRAWAKWLAFAAFGAVCLQGILGGARVIENSTAKAMAHGILAQLTFGLVVSLAVVLSDRYRTLTPNQKLIEPALARRVKFLCTLTMHSLILQLILGAWYRHFHSKHVLYTHIAFSIVVLIGATLAGFTLGGEKARQNIVGSTIGKLGLALSTVAMIQFLLGWITFAYVGTTPDTASIPQALIRTAHQANGAILLALAAACFVWGRRLGRATLPPTPAIHATP
jgi:cytochrome c oxidase assembly protein subunit 15